MDMHTRGTNQQPQATKDPDGGWSLKRIMTKKHDDLARQQVHITKSYYPQAEFNLLEPLEKRKLFLSQKAVHNMKEVATALVPDPRIRRHRDGAAEAKPWRPGAMGALSCKDPEPQRWSHKMELQKGNN